MKQDQTGSNASPIRVWDPLVRVFHWSLVAAFATAYITEGEEFPLHAWAGYAVGGLLALRIVWGLIGSRHARFSDFVCGPSIAWRYFRDLIALRATRHLGHSPAGGVMVLALLLSLSGTVCSGLVVYGGDRHAGPLASLFPPPPGAGESKSEAPIVEAAEEVHELLANFTLLLIAMHLAGVAWASYAHHENLVRAMLTGNKRG